jgi:2-oxoglutarate ferredoxin oxidoreductase subunit gamma
MNKPSLVKYQPLISEGGLIIINSSLVTDIPSREDVQFVQIPANDFARELGSDRTINMIMLGALVARTGITTPDSIMKGLSEIIKAKKASLMELNRKGLEKGAEYSLKA